MRSLCVALLAFVLLLGSAGAALSDEPELSPSPVRVIKPADIDPELLRYYREVLEVVQSAWHRPEEFAFRQDLATLVTVTIGKDGRLVGWTVDRRSGDAVYDETVAGTLRSVERLPPIPESLRADTIEIPLRFLPGRSQKEQPKE